MSDPWDKEGKNAEARFTEIRAHFLECLKFGGIDRKELYYRPKPGDAREPTEEEVVRKWAAGLNVPVNDILAGITRAFEMAGRRGDVVTSFRYCVPHIVNAATDALTRRVPL
jgi:hypothetical protein